MRPSCLVVVIGCMLRCGSRLFLFVINVDGCIAAGFFSSGNYPFCPGVNFFEFSKMMMISAVRIVLRTMFPIRLGSALQIRGSRSRTTTLLVYQYTRFMSSQKTSLRLSKITPRFHETCIVVPRIYYCKKVNLVKNGTYKVLSRRRRY